MSAQEFEQLIAQEDARTEALRWSVTTEEVQSL
jgi:hypothetical protein